MKTTHLVSSVLIALMLSSFALSSVETINVDKLSKLIEQPGNWVVYASNPKSSKQSQDSFASIVDKVAKDFPHLSFAQVEGSEEEMKDLIVKHTFVQLPSAMMYYKGVDIPIANKHLKSAKTLRTFLEGTMIAVSQKAESLNDLKELTEEVNTVLYHTENQEDEKIIIGAASVYRKYHFLTVENEQDLIDYAAIHKVTITGGKTNILVKREHDQSLINMDLNKKLTDNRLASFIVHSFRNSWVMYNSKTLEKIEDTDRYVLLFNYSEKDSETLEELKLIAKRAYADLLTVFVPQESKLGQKMLQSMGLPLDQSNLFIVEPQSSGLFKKYVADKKVVASKASLEKFVEDCINDDHPAYLLSEEAPAQDLFPGIQTLVGKNIEEKVFKDTTKHHVILFYDKETVDIIPAFQKSVKKFADLSIQFYSFDTDKNEFEDMEADTAGNLVLYSKKNGMHVERIFAWDEEATPKDLKKFLVKNLKKDKEVVENIEKIDFTTDL